MFKRRKKKKKSSTLNDVLALGTIALPIILNYYLSNRYPDNDIKNMSCESNITLDTESIVIESILHSNDTNSN